MPNESPEKESARIRRKLLGAMILVPAVPFFLVLSIGYYYFTSSVEESTFAHISRIAHDHKRVVQMFLDERLQDLAYTSQVFSYGQLVEKDVLSRLFARLKAKSPAFVDLGVFDGNGLHVAYQGPYQLQGKSYAEATWFREVMKQGCYLSDVFLGYRKAPHFVVAIRAGRNGESWVLRATIDPHFFTDLVERVRMGKTGEAYILNSEGLLQTGRRSGGGLLDKSEESLSGLTPLGKGEAFRSKSPDGNEYVYATAWLNDKKWLLVVRQDVSDAFSALREATYLGLIILLVGGAGIVSIAFLTTNSLIFRMEMADREKRDLDQQLIMASRLAELGEMSAGFAHEINNPLQIIKTEQALIQTILQEMVEQGEFKPDSEVDEVLDSVDQISQQVERCAVITQSILKFARQKDPKPQSLRLAEFTKQIAHMIRNKAEINGVELVVKAAPENLAVHVDPGQLQQVLLNLLNNAIDAVTQRPKGADGVVELEVSAQDGMALLRVTDNGPGISPQNQGKIFQPFFTTKPVGKGTGLGLSVSYGIVAKMEGSLAVESQEGHGASFLIKLPAEGEAGRPDNKNSA